MKGGKFRYILIPLLAAVLAFLSMIVTFKILNNPEAKIGVVLELTGDIANYGSNARNGIVLALEQFKNDKFFNDHSFSLIIRDCKGDAKTAAAIARELIDVKQVKVIIGAISSSATLAMADIANESKVILISPGASTPDLTNRGRYIFRIYPSDELEACALFLYLKDNIQRFGHRAAVIYIQNSYGFGLKQEFENRFRNLGEIVLSEGYRDKAYETRITDIIEKIRNLYIHDNLDFIYIAGYYQDVGFFWKRMRERGIKLPVFSSTGIEDAEIFKIGGENLDIYYPSPSIDIDNPPEDVKIKVNVFVEKYKKMFGKKPNFPALLGYDAITLVLKSIRKRKSYDPDSIRKGLLEVKGYKGLSGEITITESGDAFRTFYLKRAFNGMFVIVDTIGRPDDVIRACRQE